MKHGQSLESRFYEQELGARVGITQTSAAGKITGWMRDFMPLGELGLPEGAMISSHSARDTGATHARRSVNPPCSWDTIMPWGGWLSQQRCTGYLREKLDRTLGLLAAILLLARARLPRRRHVSPSGLGGGEVIRKEAVLGVTRTR